MTEKRTDRIVNKLRQTAAFTLAEALVATIIMLLVTSIMVAGIPAAIRAYDKVVIASNAEVLMSTAMAELRNALKDEPGAGGGGEKREVTSCQG